MSVLNDYDEVLVGQKRHIAPKYFSTGKAGNERTAVSVIRYALEVLLGWKAQEAIRIFRPEYIRFMRLEQVVEYINFPSDVPHDDTEYILYLLYPHQVDYNVKKYTIKVYDAVLKGNIRYPKDYMYGLLGLLRARICLQYALNKDRVFKSIDDLYRFFTTKEAVRYLKRAKLHQLYTSFYSTPLEYMHYSMPSSIQNDFLFHNYQFMQCCAAVLPKELFQSLPRPKAKVKAIPTVPEENAFLRHNKVFLDKYVEAVKRYS